MFSEAISDSRQRHSRREFLATASYLFADLPSRFAFGLDDKDAVNMGETPSPASVNRAILLAAGYMQRACGPDGRFVYLVDVRTGEESPSYNVVRHAGAIHALAMLQRQYPSAETKAAMLRATGYLRRLYLGTATVPDVLVVWSKPAPDHKLTVLGASGLGLLALAEVSQQSPESVPLAELQALGRFILSQQREDGSFASKYSLAEGSEDTFESLYYPGETTLGLLALYELDRSPAWLNAATSALAYLARSRRNLSQPPADHWAFIATAQLFSICDETKCTFPKGELLRHAEQICISILQEGTLSATGSTARTTPIATRVEGLLAALAFLPDTVLCMKVEVAVNSSILLLVQAQLSSGRYAGGMSQSMEPLTSSLGRIRIDYVQHALSAWLLYTSCASCRKRWSVPLVRVKKRHSVHGS